MKKKENIVHYSGIGAVNYVKSHRAKRISIRINQMGEIRVTVPFSVRVKNAEAFFLSRETWVRKQLDRLQRASYSGRLPESGDLVFIRDRAFRLPGPEEGKNAMEELWKLLRKEAQSYLPARLDFLAQKFEYQYTGLKIRKMRTRWGSCTARRSINLNSWLMMVPEHLSDYVILHELAHTRYPDHGARFWEELDRVTAGQSKKLRKELNGYQIMRIPCQRESAGLIHTE